MNLAVFVSGRGSNMQALLDASRRGDISSEVALVFSDNENSKALEVARELGIEAVCRKGADAEFLLDILRKCNIDAIVLAGYLKMIPAEVVDAYGGRIINIHPSLLPRFGGRGFYGINVHRAVLADMLSERGGESAAHRPYYTGATVHLVNFEYDKGDILIQVRVDVSDLGSAEDIAERVLRFEHKIIVEGVRLLEERGAKCAGRL